MKDGYNNSIIVDFIVSLSCAFTLFQNKSFVNLIEIKWIQMLYIMYYYFYVFIQYNLLMSRYCKSNFQPKNKHDFCSTLKL